MAILRQEHLKKKELPNLGVLFFGRADFTPSSFLYKGDDRVPKHIFQEGFTAPGSNLTISRYLDVNNPFSDSGYVSIYRSKLEATLFPFDSELSTGAKFTYVYEINPQTYSINLKDALKHEFGAEDLMETEVAVLSKVKPQDIKGAWAVELKAQPCEIFVEGRGLIKLEDDIIRTVKEPFIANPSYKSPHENFQMIWRIGKWLGHALTGVAMTFDGINLFDQVKESRRSGDYENTYKEATRIAGSWSGAYTLGMTSAKASAQLCAYFPHPYAPPVCALAGGLAGSFCGYLGGGEIATKFFDALKPVVNYIISSGQLIDEFSFSPYSGLSCSLPSATKSKQETKADQQTSVIAATSQIDLYQTMLSHQVNSFRQQSATTIPKRTEMAARQQERIASLTSMGFFASSANRLAPAERVCRLQAEMQTVKHTTESRSGITSVGSTQALMLSQREFHSSLASTIKSPDLASFTQKRATVYLDTVDRSTAAINSFFMYTSFEERPIARSSFFASSRDGEGNKGGYYCDALGNCYSTGGTSRCDSSSSGKCESSLKF